jgi:hypothetical protein
MNDEQTTTAVQRHLEELTGESTVPATIESLPETEREAFDIVQIQGMSNT